MIPARSAAAGPFFAMLAPAVAGDVVAVVLPVVVWVVGMTVVAGTRDLVV